MWWQILGEVLNKGGTLGANLADANAIFTDADMARMKELKRRQELGQLGLSDEELGNLRANTTGPVQAALREQGLRALSDTQIQDVGSGAYFAARQARDDQYARRMGDAGRSIAAAQESARQSQEKELLDLARQQDVEKAAKTKAWMSLLSGSGESTDYIGNVLGQERADREEEDAIFGSMAEGDAADTELLKALFANYGG